MSKFLGISIVLACLGGSAQAACPLGDEIPISDANGVAQVCDSFGDVLTVRGGPPNKPIPVNRLFTTTRCPTRTGFVEPHTPRTRERPWPPGVTPMHFRCDGGIVKLGKKKKRR